MVIELGDRAGFAGRAEIFVVPIGDDDLAIGVEAGDEEQDDVVEDFFGGGGIVGGVNGGWGVVMATLGFVDGSPQGARYRELSDKISESLAFMSAIGVTPETHPGLARVAFFTSCGRSLT